MTDIFISDGCHGPLIEVPSGQPITFLDVVSNADGPEGHTLRFRFLAPQIARNGGTVDFATAVEDMRHLCEVYALPRSNEFGTRPALIIVSLSDTTLTFGETAPDATQYFDAFSPKNGNCIWENI